MVRGVRRCRFQVASSVESVPELGGATRVGIVHQNWSGARQHIVRVLRDPSLSAYSQISGGFRFHWCPWLCGGIGGCCRRYCRQELWPPLRQGEVTAMLRARHGAWRGRSARSAGGRSGHSVRRSSGVSSSGVCRVPDAAPQLLSSPVTRSAVKAGSARGSGTVVTWYSRKR